MELRQLRYFVSAAAHLNFTKAAKECYIVQSSMTEQIANLESELEVKLFDRQSKGLALTEAGRFFLPKAKAILGEAEKAGEEMASFRAGYRSLLRVGYQGELFKAELIRTLRACRQVLPQVRVALRQLPEEELLEGLRDGQFDIILIPWQESFRGEDWLETSPIAVMGPVLVTAADHPLAGQESVCMEQLRGLTFVSLEASGQKEVQSRISTTGVEAPSVELALDHTSNEILVAGGCGVSLWAEGLSRFSANPELRFIPIRDYPSKKSFVLAWRRERLTGEGEWFCRLFQM